MAWTDEPISDRSEDTLGRADFAAGLADLIDGTHDPDSSIVIGLTGAWGSGKTSAFGLAEAALKRSQWKIVRLNPWVAASEEAMLAEFFAALSRALPPNQGALIRSNLATVTALAGPALSALPLVGDAAAGYVAKLQAYLTTRDPWPVAFEKACEEFRALQLRVVVFVDDCDRLDPIELRTLLKVVRLVGRFPGVTYVLAYDEETLARTLSAAGVGDNSIPGAQRYLEKIVQFVVPVPQMRSSEVLDRLLSAMRPVLITHGWDPDLLSEYRLSKALDTVMLRRLATPRSIDRFIAQAEHLFRRLDVTEFNGIDLLLLLFVRLQFPEGFAQLPYWRDELLGSGRVGGDPWSQQKGEPLDWAALLAHAGERPGDRQGFRDSLAAVFPALDADPTSEERQLRAASRLYFERHVYFGIAEDEVRDKEVIDALGATQQSPADYASFDALMDPNEPKHATALQKVRGHTEAWVEGDCDLAFVLHVMQLHNSIPESLSLASYRASLRFWVASLLPLLRNEIDGASLATTLLTTCGAETTAFLVRRMYVPDCAWADELRKETVRICKEHALAQLDEKDHAPVNSRIGWSVRFLASMERLDDLRADVRARLMAGSLRVEDVAARCVQVVWAYGDDRPRLEKVDEEFLRTLVGTANVPALSEVPEFDPYDIGWENRRKWAQWTLAQSHLSDQPSNAGLASS